MELGQHVTRTQGADPPTPGLGRDTTSRSTEIYLHFASTMQAAFQLAPLNYQTARHLPHRKLHLSSHTGNPRAADTTLRVPSHTWKCSATPGPRQLYCQLPSVHQTLGG